MKNIVIHPNSSSFAGTGTTSRIAFKVFDLQSLLDGVKPTTEQERNTIKKLSIDCNLYINDDTGYARAYLVLMPSNRSFNNVLTSTTSLTTDDSLFGQAVNGEYSLVDLGAFENISTFYNGSSSSIALRKKVTWVCPEDLREKFNADQIENRVTGFFCIIAQRKTGYDISTYLLYHARYDYFTRSNKANFLSKST
jgi:hypothetical protein